MSDERLDQLKPDQLAQVYRNVFGTPDGRLVLKDLERKCFFKIPTYECSYGKDAAEGMRMVYLHIDTQLSYTEEHNPSLEGYE